MFHGLMNNPVYSFLFHVIAPTCFGNNYAIFRESYAVYKANTELRARARVLDKLTVPQPVMKLLAFYRTRRRIYCFLNSPPFGRILRQTLPPHPCVVSI
jgi:hypothetical protein